MATVRRQLKDKNGNNVIPVISDKQPLALYSMMVITAQDGGDPVASGTNLSFSDTAMGTKALQYEYDDYGLLSLTAGTCYYTHKKGIEILDVEMTITGNCNAFWLQTTHQSPLNGAIYIPNGHPLLSKNYAGWGGAVFHVFYDVRGMNIGDSFYINPVVQVYGGNANINRGGTVGSLVVKALGKVI